MSVSMERFRNGFGIISVPNNTRFLVNFRLGTRDIVHFHHLKFLVGVRFF